jgi:uncharacterized C2H2 Zn-finger protein
MPHACGRCDQTFATNQTLARHVNAVHDGLKPHACKQCGKAFSQKGSLATHVTRVHSTIRPHPCRECDMAFVTSCDLDRHITAVHDKLKPYACGMCDAAFPTRGNLTLHVAAVHSGLKPYPCPQCGESFSQKTNRDRHVAAVHDGARPYACTDCDAAFAQKGNLAAHVAAWHTMGAVIRRKKEELRVQDSLEAGGFVYSAIPGDSTPLSMHFNREHTITFKCMGGTWARIDFVVTLHNGSIVLLEVDEKQHRFGYGEVSCDMRRMGRVIESLRVGGYIGGIRFLRYNCDAFKVDGKLVKVPKNVREAALLGVLHTWGAEPPLDDGMVTISYCYYDRKHAASTQPLVVDDPDYHATYAAVVEALL